MQRSKLGKRTWFNLILFGTAGQIAWNVENMVFNTFLYNSIYGNVTDQAAIDNAIPFSTAISNMVALSAVAAFVSTLLLGTLSDRMNRRKIFLSAGYIAWGIVTACFGFISLENTAAILQSSDMLRVLTVTVWTVIIMDVIMTFMGSLSNDASFNAWVTDVTDESNRPVTESVLAVLPLAATGIVMGLMAVVGKIGYSTFFLILGASVTLCGVIGLFSLNESRSGIRQVNGNYWADVIYGFRPSVVKQHKDLYLSFAAVCIFNISVQVWFPYLFIYLEHVILKNTPELLGAKTIIGAVIALAIIVPGILILLTKQAKIGRTKVFLIASVGFVVGLFLVFAFGRDVGSTLPCIAPALVGYAVLTILLNATVRDYTPEDKVGQFQGIRMVFYVLIPMVVGPYIGDLAISNSTRTYMNEFNVETPLPTETMFLAAAVIAVFVFVPVLLLWKRSKNKQIADNT
ncbi:MAG: MFS transporter [Clostridia bacterium]|nr:MFS transporter [Clostridia bacterium]MBR2414711.1 MFS transporter [Clostridia bacterium]MBR3954648.1 MFS transporter [Clostridia bacterium]